MNSALPAFNATRIVEVCNRDPLTKDPICWLDTGKTLLAIRSSTLELVASLINDGVAPEEAREVALANPLSKRAERERSVRLMDITGEVHGRWTVLRLAPLGAASEAIWICRCNSCGHQAQIKGFRLRNRAPACPGCSEKRGGSWLGQKVGARV